MAAQAIPTFKRAFETREKLGKLISGNKPEFRFSEEGCLKILGFKAELKVVFAYANDSSNLESATAICGVWDEAGQKENKQESYEAFDRRLAAARSTRFEDVLEFAPQWWIERFYNVEGPEARFGRRLWGTTPYTWNWFKNLIYNRAEKKEDGFELCNWPSWLSPRVDEAVCKAKQAVMPMWRWLMMYMGQYTRPAGAIYDTFDYDRDTCKDFDIPPNWKVYPGVDFGLANVAGVLVAEDPETKTLYLIREYHAGCSRTIPDHIGDIVGPYKSQLLPGAAGSHQESDNRSAYGSQGLILNEPPANSVDVQIQAVYAQIKAHNLQIFRSCQNIIEDFQHYAYETDEAGNPTDKIEDKSTWHRLDACRYVVSMLRPYQPAPAGSAPAVRTTSDPRLGGRDRGYDAIPVEGGGVVYRPKGVIGRRYR
jgi:hypothetical protein